MTRLLALDPGRVSGFAVFDINEADHTATLLTYGTIGLRSKDVDDIVCTHWCTLRHFAEDTGHPFVVAFEEPIHSSRLPGDTEASEARGVIRLFCATEGRVSDYTSFAPATVKSCLTGKGNANKKIVAAAVKHLLAIPKFRIDHEPDAVAIGVTYCVRVAGVAVEQIDWIGEGEAA